MSHCAYWSRFDKTWVPDISVRWSKGDGTLEAVLGIADNSRKQNKICITKGWIGVNSSVALLLASPKVSGFILFYADPRVFACIAKSFSIKPNRLEASEINQ